MKRFYDEHIGDAMKNFLKKGNAKLANNYYENKINSILQDKLGSLLAGFTAQVTFANAKLIIKVDSSSLKNELLNGKDQLKKIVNKELGEIIVQTIIVQ